MTAEGQNLSVSNRLAEVARRAGTDAYPVGCAADIQPQWIDGQRHLGIAAGASAPDFLVEEVVDCLQGRGVTTTREVRWTQEDGRVALTAELMS